MRRLPWLLGVAALTAGCELQQLPGRPGHTTAPADVAATVRARLDSLPGRTSLYAKDLRTGREISIRADEPMNTASVIKLPVMIRAYRDNQRGTLDLDRRHILRLEEGRRGSGLVQTFAPGLNPTLRDLIAQMIVTSDNTATDILIATVGLDRVNAMLDSLGYTATRLRMTTGDLFKWIWVLADPANARMSHRDVFEQGFPSDTGMPERIFMVARDSAYWLGTMTAREAGRMLEQLENGELADSARTAEMRGHLLGQVFTSRLPQRLQFEASIGHKTGDIPPVLGNDIGIIYTPRGPIVVAVFTNENRGDFFVVESAIGNIARDLFEAWGR